MAAAPIVAKGAGEASKALTGDIVRIDTQYFRIQEIGEGEDKQEILVPLNVEVHLNPLNVGLGLLGLGIAALAGVIAWNGIEIPGLLGGEITLIKGIKDTALGKRITETATVRALTEKVPEDPACAELQDRWNRRWWNPLEQRTIKQDAKNKGCAWAQ